MYCSFQIAVVFIIRITVELSEIVLFCDSQQSIHICTDDSCIRDWSIHFDWITYGLCLAVYVMLEMLICHLGHIVLDMELVIYMARFCIYMQLVKYNLLYSSKYNYRQRNYYMELSGRTLILELGFSLTVFPRKYFIQLWNLLEV